jgi:copper chaperone CopZ
MKQIILITILALSMVACSPKQAPKEKAAPVLVEAKLKVEGMTCTECEQSIAKGVNQLAGIDSISANHLDSTAFVRFDPSKTDLPKISAAIEGRGYQVVASNK